MFVVTVACIVSFVDFSSGILAQQDEETQWTDTSNIASLTVEDFYIEMPGWEESCYIRPINKVTLSELSSGVKLMKTCANTTIAVETDGLPSPVAKICEEKQLYALEECGDKRETETTGLKRKKRCVLTCGWKLSCSIYPGIRICGNISGFSCAYKSCCSCNWYM